MNAYVESHCKPFLHCEHGQQGFCWPCSGSAYPRVLLLGYKYSHLHLPPLALKIYELKFTSCPWRIKWKKRNTYRCYVSEEVRPYTTSFSRGRLGTLIYKKKQKIKKAVGSSFLYSGAMIPWFPSWRVHSSTPGRGRSIIHDHSQLSSS